MSTSSFVLEEATSSAALSGQVGVSAGIQTSTNTGIYGDGCWFNRNGGTFRVLAINQKGNNLVSSTYPSFTLEFMFRGISTTTYPTVFRPLMNSLGTSVAMFDGPSITMFMSSASAGFVTVTGFLGGTNLAFINPSSQWNHCMYQFWDQGSQLTENWWINGLPYAGLGTSGTTRTAATSRAAARAYTGNLYLGPSTSSVDSLSYLFSDVRFTRYPMRLALTSSAGQFAGGILPTPSAHLYEYLRIGKTSPWAKTSNPNFYLEEVTSSANDTLLKGANTLAFAGMQTTFVGPYSSGPCWFNRNGGTFRALVVNLNDTSILSDNDAFNLSFIMHPRLNVPLTPPGTS
jgi:hypothetical protein